MVRTACKLSVGRFLPAALLPCAALFSAAGDPVHLGGKTRWDPVEISMKGDAGSANPFTLRFEATVTAPDGSSTKSPGFFDGNGTWKLRLLPHSPGKWLVETESDLPSLAGGCFAFECLPQAAPGRHGRLRVDAKHPRHFLHEDGTRHFMMAYECDWLWALDSADPALPAIRAFLDRIWAHGFNSVLLNAYAYDTSWRTGTTGPDDFGPPPRQPWEGTFMQPDYLRLNLAYWQHFDCMMQALHDRGIIAHLMCKVYNKKVPWPAPGSPGDDLFFRTLIARCAAFPGLIWNFSKEAQNEKDLSYKLDRLRHLKTADPWRHLVTCHDDDAAYEAGSYNGLVDFRTDQQHRGWRTRLLKQRALHSFPLLNAEFGYEHGAGGPQDITYGQAQPPRELVLRAWEISFAGGYTAYYHTHTAWDVLRPEIQPPGYVLFGHLRRFFESTRYWELSPREEKGRDPAAPRWILENPGSEYAIWLPPGRRFPLADLGATGKMKGVWWNPLTGASLPADVPTGDGREFSPPAEWLAGPVILHLTCNTTR